jgi:hypothetical protein
MCTVSWIHRPGGYDLLCNRDEKRTRGVAAPPELVDRGGLQYISPTDADAGGTWIAVNEYGLALCLLNGPSRPAERSRGFVIPDLIWARSIDDCAFLFSRLDHTLFASFTLLMIEPDTPAAIATWDGSRAEINLDARSPLTSSSFDTEAVCRERLQEFARRNPAGPDDLYRFHTSHSGRSLAHAPCMHRPDAETVSFSWITVAAEGIQFRYLPAAPCAKAA